MKYTKKLLGFIAIIIIITLIGFLFLIHGLAFAFFSFLFSIGSIAYLVFSLKRYMLYKRGSKKIEILKSCFDVVAYVLVLVMIFTSIFPNILFFTDLLKKYIKEEVVILVPETASEVALEVVPEEEVAILVPETVSEVAFEIVPEVVPKAVLTPLTVPNVEIYSGYFSDKPFLQGFLLKFPVTSKINIPYSFYNFYCVFVFVFNIMYTLAGIHFVILFPVIKIVLSALKDSKILLKKQT